MRYRALTISAFAVLLSGGMDSALWAGTDQPSPAAADNTERNIRDRSGNTLTPFDQSEHPADRTLTQRIRQALMKDDSLSTAAKNVKIVAVDGRVTLRGPVSSDREKAAITAQAEQIAGKSNVDNQIEVAKTP